MGDLEDTALALDFAEFVFVAAVGHVLAIDDDARVPRHLVTQGGIDKINDCPGPAMGLGRLVEVLGSRIDTG